MIGKVNGYIEEKNGSKYLVLDSANIKQRSTKKYIMNFEMGLKMSKTSEYDKDFMKMKFDLDDDLPLNKQLKFPTVTIVVRSVFEDEGKLYPHIYLDECLYEL